MGKEARIAVILNSNQLGGAERSLIEQLSISNKQSQYVFFIPLLSISNQRLVNFLNEKGFFNIFTYPFPRFIYGFTQKDVKKIFLLPFFLPILFYYILIWHLKFKHFDSFYINGNKASFPIFAWATFTRKRIQVKWHFRDYPHGFFFRIILYCLRFSHSLLDLELVANSHSVASEIQKLFNNKKVHVIYNLPGQLIYKPEISKIETIGIVAMPSAWKGLHTVILMSSLYEKELRALGIKKIVFYGDKIYQTGSEQQEYVDQLQKLQKKLSANLVEWKTGIGPEKIFSEIDLLIHSSTRPEPFGRVIVEAFRSGTPVISSALGGAKELMDYQPYPPLMISFDYRGLFSLIEYLGQHPEIQLANKESAYKFVMSLESKFLNKTYQPN